MAVTQPAPVVPALIQCPVCHQNGTAFKPLFRFEPGVPPLIHPQGAAIRFVVCNYCHAVIASVA
jgi:hypothetical protein